MSVVRHELYWKWPEQGSLKWAVLSVDLGRVRVHAVIFVAEAV